MTPGRILPTLGLLGLLLAACGEPEAEPPPPLPALATPVSLLRLPQEGGYATVWSPDSLRALEWRSDAPIPPIEAILGADLDDQIVYLHEGDGDVAGLDLESGTVRPLLPQARVPTAGPDGALFAVVEGRIVRLAQRRVHPYRSEVTGQIDRLFGTLNGQVTVFTTADSVRMALVGPDRAGVPRAVPAGSVVGASPWGDQVAVVAGDEITLHDATERGSSHRIAVPSGTEALRYSASGHRIYLVGRRPTIDILDRFTRKRLPPITIPGPARDLRSDFSGRWLLVRPAGLDSVWVVDAASGRHVTTVATVWDADLPLVTGGSTLLIRSAEGSVASLDIGVAPPRETGRIADAGADLWMAIRWLPRALRGSAIAAAETALVAQDSSLVLPPAETVEVSADARIFLQISSSRNPEWARALARQVTSLGFPATVAVPKSRDDGYRVIVGPYPSRDAAEEAGRRLGRPYFVLTRDP